MNEHRKGRPGAHDRCSIGRRRALGTAIALAALVAPMAATAADNPKGGAVTAPVNRIRRIERVARAPALAGRPGVEIELESDRPFADGGALAELHIGAAVFTVSRFADSALHRIVFVLECADFARLKDGAAVRVQLGRTPPPDRVWTFPPFVRSSAR